ncbi:ABC transporter permease [Corynebacterium riegelii]|uniref:ABC transporter permease n=1 Tax=Corynebacterium riegelii TaxID=156976 RepID=A0A0K1RBS9_9CORY|nr:ABC transporter permease [Corynebacterium riegelii]AKV58848.1 ABC transporter permease [Corynebacterium riegelii]
MKTYSPMHTITTTAKREVQILLLKKGVIVTLVIMLLAILGMIGVGSWMKNKDEAEAEGGGPAIAAMGIAEQLLNDAGYDARTATDRTEAEQLVRDGDVQAALIVEGDTWEVLADGSPSTSILTGLDALSQQQARAETLSNLGISPADYEAASPQVNVVPVDINDTEGADADGTETAQLLTRMLTTFFALIIIMFTVITFAAQVGSRVTEEKSSRVVELILASVRPLDFLAGKLLGTVVFGFLATAVLLAVGGVGLKVSGLIDDVEIDWSVLPILFVAWLLSMLFFGGLYAAAGAMVQRTEDLQSTQMPILILLMACVYIPSFGWSNTDTTFMQVVSWIPPFSIFAAPLTYAAGDFTAIQLAGSFTLAAVTTVLVVWGAARIYKRTILNNSSVTKWTQVLRRG